MGQGPTSILIRGSGYSLIWEEERTDPGGLEAGIMFRLLTCGTQSFQRRKRACPVLGDTMDRYGDYIGVTDWKRYSENDGEQIEYEDEDPEIRNEFEAELSKIWRGTEDTTGSPTAGED